jgi:hypothetical protein
MSNRPQVNDLIEEIKRKAEALEFSGDEIEFDKRVGELDGLLFKLRSVAWTPVQSVQLHELLKDIIGD